MIDAMNETGRWVSFALAAFILSGCAQTLSETAEIEAAAPQELGAAPTHADETPKAMSIEDRFKMLSAGPRMTHCDDPVDNPTLNPDMRYEGAVPPPCSTNVHGQTELLKGDVEATHWFVEADEVTWHFVTAGDPSNEPVIFLHGLPESWYGFNYQMAALSDEYYTISVDQLGYGQSDKRLELDYSNPAMAAKLAALIDKLGIESFYAVGHDRGSVTIDYMMPVGDMSNRIKKYVRMQQSGNRPHGEPLPPHEIFASQLGVETFARDRQVRSLYTTRSGFSAVNVDPEEVDRLAYEFLYEGAAEAISENFKTTNFDLELEDRMKDGGLFDYMTMPVLFLQGALDPGQHREEYLALNEDVPLASVIMVEDASHFLHVERPEKVTQIIREFLAEQ